MVAICDNCGEVMHRVLKGKISGRRETIFEGVVKCQRCGRISRLVITEPKPFKVPLILSWMEKSRRGEIEIERQGKVTVGEIMEFEGGKIQITAIESEGRRVMTSEAGQVSTLWAKKVDKVRIKVTTTRGRKSRSKEILVEPQEEFQVDDEIWLDGERSIIGKIKVHQRTLYRGSATASDIKRIYTWIPSPRRLYRPAPEKKSARRDADDDGRESRHRQ